MIMEINKFETNDKYKITAFPILKLTYCTQ